MLLVSKRPQPTIAGSVKWAMSSRNDGLPSSCHHEASGDSADRWASVARERLTLFVHVGHTSAADARALATHAERINADAIGCLAPYFFKPRTVEELADFCGHVAAAAPGLPFYYHLPSLTGVAFPMRDFLPVAARRIPTLASIKYTCEDVEDFAACVAFDGGRFDMLFGRDELLLAGLDAGAAGAIGSTYNYMAPIYRRLVAAWAAGDRLQAKQLQARATAIIDVMIRHGGLPAGTQIMGLGDRLRAGPAATCESRCHSRTTAPGRAHRGGPPDRPGWRTMSAALKRLSRVENFCYLDAGMAASVPISSILKRTLTIEQPTSSSDSVA